MKHILFSRYRRPLGVIFLSVFFSVILDAQDMSHISSIIKYVLSVPEEVEASSTHSWLDPDYSTFYRELFNRPYASPVFNFVYGLVHMRRYPEFGRQEIAQALAAYNTLVPRTLIREGEIVYDMLRLQTGDQVFIFGDLHGALHSLTRDLVRLQDAGVIDDSLKLTKPQTYIVCLGDYLNRSPYGFQLLTVLLHLAAKNPGQVFLLRGNQERGRYWEDFLASREFLKNMSKLSYTEVLPFALEVNNVFERLPDALILHHAQAKEDIVCTQSTIPERYRKQPSTQAFLMGESRSGKWLPSGLIFEEFVEGTACWKLFSAPLKLYKNNGGLAQDAWCVLEVADSFSRGVLQSIQAEPVGLAVELPSVQRRLVSLAYGHEILTKEDLHALQKSNPYFICASGDLSASMRSVAFGTKRGAEACFLDANQAGGVQNYFFRLIFLDDRYVPLLMAENVKIFRERYGSDALFLAQGSATIQELLPQIKTGNFFIFFPYTGSVAFRRPELRSMIHARQSYFDEVDRMVVYFQEKFNSKKIALVYQDDAFGAPIAQHVKTYLETKSPAISIALVPFARGQLGIDNQLQQLKAYNPESIGFFVTNPAQINTLITALGVQMFVGRNIFALAFDEYFTEVAKRWGVRALFSTSFQPPQLRQGSLMNRFRLLMNRYTYPISIPAYEAFFCSSLFLRAMRQVEGAITSEKILRAIENLSGTEFFGSVLHFDPEKRGFNLSTWVFEVDGSVKRLDSVVH